VLILFPFLSLQSGVEKLPRGGIIMGRMFTKKRFFLLLILVAGGCSRYSAGDPPRAEVVRSPALAVATFPPGALPLLAGEVYDYAVDVRVVLPDGQKKTVLAPVRIGYINGTTLSTPRAFFGYVRLRGMNYVIGGYSGGTATATMEVFIR
jgi:hypothetical protein